MKTNKSKNIIKFILCFILVAVLAASLTFNVLMYLKLIDVSAQKDVYTIDTGEIVLTPAESSRMTLSAAVALDNASSFLIQVAPDVEVPGKLVRWDLRFVDTAPDNINGRVYDYATITPISDGARAATLKVLRDFSYQIIVRASMIGDESINATCTVDYRQRIIAVKEIQNADYGEARINYGSKKSEGTILADTSATLDPYMVRELDTTFIPHLLTLYDDTEFISNLYGCDKVLESLNVFIASMQNTGYYDYLNWFNQTYCSSLHDMLPFFNYGYFNELSNDYGIICAGFNMQNSSSRDRVRYMMFRFLGIYPPSAIEKIGRDKIFNPEAFEWSNDEYYEKMQSEIDREELSRFMEAFSRLLERKAQESDILCRYRDFTDLPLEPQDDFRYIFTHPVYSVQLDKRYDVLWVLNAI